MASASSKTVAETAETAPTTDPIEKITESVVSLSLNNEKSDSDPEENDSFDHNEDSDVSDGEKDSKSDGDHNQNEDDGDSIVDDGDSTDSQPEWGVDSHDEREYCSPDEDGWSDEEDERKARLYRRNLHFSHGFLVQKGIRPRQVWSGSILLKSLDSERSPVKERTQIQYAQDMAKLSLRKYNALNKTNVRVDHVVRVTEAFSGRWISYITFMAMARVSEEEEATDLVEYQAKIVKKLRRKSSTIFCRPSPKQDQDM
ncbi:hypothetical protein F2Q70_00008413 [Brassica cretica]|uniref:Uncharacterized protein n=1 Tax=Brassica cretica TaxID=69181 RepID=A0A3N6SJ30_BRACR|nr:hypothetical protein F2Q70_00008413 [Brassica cretica]KAF3550833.1 hypothetical protein DY000_02001904 [Brassica cretica]